MIICFYFMWCADVTCLSRCPSFHTPVSVSATEIRVYVEGEGGEGGVRRITPYGENDWFVSEF
jgi:hypothetical protein